MPLINLIQEQRLAVKRDERKARAFFLLFAGVAVASVGSYGFLSFRTEALQDQEAKLKAVLQANAPLVRDIEMNEKELAALTPRLKTLEDAQLMTSRWGRIMAHLAQNTPSEAWLTAMRASVTDPSKPIAINVTGLSPAQEPVSEFIMRLQNSGDLENVQLKYTQEKLIQASKAIEFEVSAEIGGTADKKPKNEESKEESQ